MRLTVLSNVNLDFLLKDLSRNHDVYCPEGYGTWEVYCLKANQELKAFAPQVIFIVLDGTVLFVDKGQDVSEQINQYKLYIENLVKIYTEAKVVVSTIDIKPSFKLGNESDSSIAVNYYWETMLTSLIAGNSRIYRLELERLITKIGRDSMYSSKMWYTGAIPYSVGGIKQLHNEMEKILNRFMQKRKKVLVTDLDNTLWGGVVGETGADGILLAPNGIGSIYQEVQKILLWLKKQGVVLCAVSKNNISDVEEVFENNRHMILEKTDFVKIIANWECKSENISELSKELNVGLDSFVFLDDNVLERDEVRLQLPDVSVIDFPKKLETYPEILAETCYDYFFAWSLTEEDLRKTDIYQSEMKRKKLQNTISYEAFLKQLNINITIKEMTANNQERVIQLIDKTNQFNTCALRMDEIALNRYRNDGGILVTVYVEDKFGDNGLVGIIMYHVDNKVVVIDNYILSCRVMGRKIENAVFGALIDRFKKEQYEFIKAKYIVTPKNGPVAGLWEKLGLAKYAEFENGVEYGKKIDDIECEKIFSVKWGV